MDRGRIEDDVDQLGWYLDRLELEVAHLDMEAARREMAEAELYTRGEHPEQLRPHFEAVLAGAAILVVLPLLLWILVALFG